jgi:hypothetical protein
MVVFQRQRPCRLEGTPRILAGPGRCDIGAPANGVKQHLSAAKVRDFELKFRVRRKNGIGNSGVVFVGNWSMRSNGYRSEGRNCGA